MAIPLSPLEVLGWELRRRTIGKRQPVEVMPTSIPILTRRIVDGVPQQLSSTDTFADALEFARSGEGRMSLTVVSHPTPEVVAELASAWQLHPLLVEDLVTGPVPGTETSLWRSYAIVIDYLNRVGLAARDPFDCPMFRQLRRV